MARRDADDVLRAWAATVTADDGQDLLQRAGVPAGKVQDAADLMSDPQLVARGLWSTCEHGVFGERPFDRYPALWSDMDLEPYLPPPSYVGEHNFEVFEELAGMDVGEIAEGMATVVQLSHQFVECHRGSCNVLAMPRTICLLIV